MTIAKPTKNRETMPKICLKMSSNKRFQSTYKKRKMALVETSLRILALIIGFKKRLSDKKSREI